MAETMPADVIGKLRGAVTSLRDTAMYREIVEPRDTYFFQVLFYLF